MTAVYIKRIYAKLEQNAFKQNQNFTLSLCLCTNFIQKAVLAFCLMQYAHCTSQGQACPIIIHLMTVHRGFEIFCHLLKAVLAQALSSLITLMVYLCQAQAASMCIDAIDINAIDINASPIAIESVSEQGELLLSDGRLVRIPGAAFPNEAQAAKALREILHNKQPIILYMSAKTNRWGRYSGQIAIDLEGQTSLIIEHLIARGHALLRPDDFLLRGKKGVASASVACLKSLERAEALARSSKLGIWAEGEALPLDATDTLKLEQFEGQFVIIQGKPSSVRERKSITFLNFGMQWAKSFSVMIPNKIWKKMMDEGTSSRTLIGKNVLVRGHLRLKENRLHESEMEAGRAPHIRLLDTYDITIMDTD